MPVTSNLLRSITLLWAFVLTFSAIVSAQSTTIEFPTPVASARISGKINARDLGDARLTSHYYVFEGTQGDILIRVQTTNFDGEVDVFNAQDLRPITKMSFISGTSATESVREIYLRKSEKMILRVEGRTANDEAATYTVRFEGSFRPSAEFVAEAPELPEVKNQAEGSVRVNSVGTIIETKGEEKRSGEARRATTSETETEIAATAEKTPENTEEAAPEREDKTEAPVAEKTVAPPATRRTAGRRSTATGRRNATERRTPPVASSTRRATAAPKTAAPDPLANVRLVIVLKEGETIEHPINQVQRFAVERGVLTIIMKTGRIVRIGVKDIARMTVE